MQTAKLFQNGRSQAVRLPKEYQFTGEDVFIQKHGDAVLLIPHEKAWEVFLEGMIKRLPGVGKSGYPVRTTGRGRL